MFEFNDIDYVSEKTDDITISAYNELLDSEGKANRLWYYGVRIENNSDQRICLLKKDFCITDCNGNNFYDYSDGFHGELPVLEPGEYFDFEDTATLSTASAVLYGCCIARRDDGELLKVKLPLTDLFCGTNRNLSIKLN